MANDPAAVWQHGALLKAMARRPDEELRQPDPAAPGVSRRIMRWRCDDGEGVVSAVKAPYEEGYRVETTCRHAQHVEIARLPYTRVEQASLVDGKSAPIDLVPSDLKGARLRFRLNSPVRGFARIEVDPDLSTRGMLPRPRIEVECGTFGPGPHVFDADLDPDAELDESVRQEVTVSIHVLDPKTALRDPGADGMCLWKRAYRVRPVNATP